MRYPVGDGTPESFERDWYVAQGFGAPTTYGFHEGADINLRTGGDTDLGQPVYAIAAGQVAYWHATNHPNTGFGQHLIYRITGLWGTRWVHQAHLSQQDFLGGGGLVAEGALIGRIGKSGGTSLAHLHFAIFKVDPGANIDNVANSRAELDLIWEDPLAFINKWMTGNCPITDDTRIPQLGNRTVSEIRVDMVALQSRLNSIKALAS